MGRNRQEQSEPVFLCPNDHARCLLDTLLPATRAGFFILGLGMPEKDPLTIGSILQWLSSSAALHGAVMASVISFLRVLYDGKEKRWQRRVLESAICGCLTLCCFGVVRLMGWPDALAVTMGGAVGFLGVDQIRSIALRRLSRES